MLASSRGRHYGALFSAAFTEQSFSEIPLRLTNIFGQTLYNYSHNIAGLKIIRKNITFDPELSCSVQFLHGVPWFSNRNLPTRRRHLYDNLCVFQETSCLLELGDLAAKAAKV